MKNVAFTRWDPLRDLLALHEQLGQLVGTDAPGWTPPVDLYETAGEFVLTAELPGLKRDQVEIHVEDARIVIRGEKSTGVAWPPCAHWSNTWPESTVGDAGPPPGSTIDKSPEFGRDQVFFSES